MLQKVTFKNFKALRQAMLPLGPLTLLIGPNGSGKSTALEALLLLSHGGKQTHAHVSSVGTREGVVVSAHWEPPYSGYSLSMEWSASAERGRTWQPPQGSPIAELEAQVRRWRLFALDARAIADAVPTRPDAELAANGAHLAAVLDELQSIAPERMEQLTTEFCRWLPEFDRILVYPFAEGSKAIGLRTREGGHRIAAADLSQGTLIALAILAVAYLPAPPTLVGFEEPDRGLHPRLLRHVRDALYRLAYPADFDEARQPVQVVATTHNPLFLDLFRDHPEEIVLADKHGLDATFRRLMDVPHYDEILDGVHLGDVWYTGVLGGVPVGV
jgi:predicted ATPase